MSNLKTFAGLSFLSCLLMPILLIVYFNTPGLKELLPLTEEYAFYLSFVVSVGISGLIIGLKKFFLENILTKLLMLKFLASTFKISNIDKAKNILLYRAIFGKDFGTEIEGYLKLIESEECVSIPENTAVTASTTNNLIDDNDPRSLIEGTKTQELDLNSNPSEKEKIILKNNDEKEENSL